MYPKSRKELMNDLYGTRTLLTEPNLRTRTLSSPESLRYTRLETWFPHLSYPTTLRFVFVIGFRCGDTPTFRYGEEPQLPPFC